MANHLIHETSPYLLQHAHNPVEWYPWGDEALQRARSEDKPILVSIGYAACHWCHVMERESFENEDTAKIMNEHFINIKIDREERPDLDHIYMDAVQAIAGNGGWPLNVFLTPDCKPFYGGTYYPPVRAFNRASWREILHGVNNLFKEKRSEVEAQAEELVHHIGRSPDFRAQFEIDPGENIFNRHQLDDIFTQLMKSADTTWGGFGKAPKFPQTFTIRFLLKYHFLTGNKEALDQACLSLDKMINGGIYDHLGGGFARYSTDEEWLAPHFEKMLYDNALLISVISDAYKLTKKASYRRTINETIKFIKREMTAPDGGFYSALDADSEGEEGRFYVWSLAEVEETLGADARLFCEYYDVSETGNWEHKNILRTKKELEVFAGSRNLKAEDFELLVEQWRLKLMARRNLRVRPQLDDKIILGWNALMITALCDAFTATGVEEFRGMAKDQFAFLWNKFRKEEGDFFHTYKNGVAKFPAFLDDLAYLGEAALRLQEITSETSYLEQSAEIIRYVSDHFSDPDDQLFYYTGDTQKDVVVRKKEIYDGAVPSSNAVMAANLRYLSVIFDKAGDLNPWVKRVHGMLLNLLPIIIKYPGSFGNWALLLSTFVTGSTEVAIVGPDHARMRDELSGSYLPGVILQSAAHGRMDFPLLASRGNAGETLVYICQNNTCAAPLKELQNSVKALHSTLKL